MTKLGDKVAVGVHLLKHTIFAFYFYSEGHDALLNPIHLFDTLVALNFPN